MKKLPLSEAISRIDPRHKVLVPPGCGHPTALVEELGRQAERFRKLTVMGGLALCGAPYFEERFQDNFHFITYHAAAPVRSALERGQASYVPLRYYDSVAAFSAGGKLAPDVVLVQVAPPDEKGRYSLGTSVSYSRPAAKTAPLVIAQLNPRMPRTLGESFLEEGEIDVLVEADEPVVEYRASEAGEVERAIAEKVAALVPDGATVQAGVGAVPEALLSFLQDKKRLRLHSLLVDAAIALYEKGACTGGPQGSAICEVMGSRRLFDFVHDNSDVFMADSAVVHEPRLVSRTPKFVSLISALEVDLSGQVAAEAVGGRPVAGIGGQLDFAMASAFCEDGFSVVALPARGGKRGEHSRIAAALAPETPVTTPRSLVHYVATEYGIVDLRGLDLDERARALISIAAPEHRESLERAYRGKSRAFASEKSQQNKTAGERG